MRLSRRPLRAALAMVIGVLAACGDGGPTAPDTPNLEDLGPGMFRLVNINGQTLPYVMMETPAQRVEITGGELAVQAGGRFAQVLTFGEFTTAGYAQRNSSVTGTYILDGDRILFRVSGGGEEFQGTRHSGTSFDYTVRGNSGPLVFLFRRD
jgi:hypothetical protein